MCEEKSRKELDESFNTKKLVDIRKDISSKYNISEEEAANSINNIIATQDSIMNGIYSSYLERIDIVRLGMRTVAMPKEISDNFIASIELSIAYNILIRISKSDCRESTIDATKKALNELKNMKDALGVESTSSDLNRYHSYKQKFH